jgi:hypothetical protein
MNQHSTETSEQIVKFTPKEQLRSGGNPMDESGQAIVAKIRMAADLANENCDRAMALAHKLAMQVRDAEDRIYQLETEVKQYQARAANAEKWLQLIEKEVEEKLIAPASRSEKSSLQ